MHKHSLFFSTSTACEEASNWIVATFDNIEDADISFENLVFFFYTAYPLSERQQQIIVDTVKPLSFLSEEL